MFHFSLRQPVYGRLAVAALCDRVILPALCLSTLGTLIMKPFIHLQTADYCIIANNPSAVPTAAAGLICDSRFRSSV